MTAPYSGALFKLTGLIKGWKQVSFRESDFVEKTYLLKFDGLDRDTGRKEQIQLLVNPRDAAAISTALEKLLIKNNPDEYKLYQEVHGVERTTSAGAVLGELQEFVNLCRYNLSYPEMHCDVMDKWIKEQIELRTKEREHR